MKSQSVCLVSGTLMCEEGVTFRLGQTLNTITSIIRLVRWLNILRSKCLGVCDTGILMSELNVITGGSGYVGLRLARELLSLGLRVRIFDTSRPRQPDQEHEETGRRAFYS